MDELELSTKRSIHPPIEVKVDGKTYQCNLLSRATFERLKKHEKAALKGDVDAIYAQVQALYPIPKEVLGGLDMRDINTLLEYTMSKIFGSKEPETEAEEEEKPQEGGTQ